MHMGYNNPYCVYTINNVNVNVIPEMNDLSIIVKNSLHFDSYINTIVGKAYLLCYNILNCLITQSLDSCDIIV